MRRRVLIIHHLEPMWEIGYNRFNTSFDEQAERTREHLESEEYDLVILTRFEDHELSDEHWETGLGEYIDQVHTYGYGWEADMANDGGEWVDGGSHSEVVPIEGWMKELTDDSVFLCGAFDGECIEDMEYALEGANVGYMRVGPLIV